MSQPNGRPAARTSVAVLVLAALVAVVVAAGGYLAYQRVTRKAGTGPGTLTRRSAEARPAWIASDAPAAATCHEVGGKAMACVGVSSISARQDDAEDEAADAALDALANALAVRITDPRWTQAVLPIYAAARDADAFDRDPTSTTARREPPVATIRRNNLRRVSDRRFSPWLTIADTPEAKPHDRAWASGPDVVFRSLGRMRAALRTRSLTLSPKEHIG